MKILSLAVGVLMLLTTMGCAGDVQARAKSATKLSQQDLVTADGSLRAGLRNGRIYAILTAQDPVIQLSPDTWTGDEESVNWNRWLVDFDNELFDKWSAGAGVDGQETVQVTIANGAIKQVASQFYSADGAGAEQQKAFEAAMGQALEQTLKGMPPMPQTKNPLKEIRMAMTFMRDPNVVPRHGREALGFVAVRNAAGDNINVFGRLNKLGQSPGIQIISERDGGTIKVTEDGPFVQKCREIDAGASPGK
jgi:hypothetical protein